MIPQIFYGTIWGEWIWWQCHITNPGHQV